MSKVLAGSPSACCVGGVKHTGTPVGRIEPFGGLNTYISEPPTGVSSGSPKKVLLWLSDVFGPLHINNKLVQDYFASCGFIVLGPDYFFGTYMQDLPEDLELKDKMAWIETKRAPAREAFPKWLNTVKETYGDPETTKYSAVGYCFGAPYVLELCAEGFVVAGAVAHPVYLTESHFENCRRPLVLSCAEEDFSFSLESRRRAEDILREKKAEYYVQVFSGVSHGYALRCNLDVPHERWAKEECARGIQQYFNHYSA